jgi:hypothetical protein
MPVSHAKMLTFALSAVMALGTVDSAVARHRKHPQQHRPVTHNSSEAAFWGNLVPMENGVPVIMKGYHPPRSVSEEAAPQRRADSPVKIPRGSSTYIPPPNPSPYSSNSPPAAALTQPAPAPYQPPPITTFSDRVNGAIQAYPLQNGVGNNPTDQQSFIRQRVNQ